MSLKNPVTPPGIDPGTVRLAAQRLNHYATPGPNVCVCVCVCVCVYIYIYHVVSKTEIHYTANLCSITYDTKSEGTLLFSYEERTHNIVNISGKLILSAHEIFDDRTHVNRGIAVIWNVLQSSALWLLLSSLR